MSTPLPGVFRTPDDAFAALDGFDFAPNYASDLPGYEGMRMHYLDEGPADAEHTCLCLHGEPTWSYLYRKFIPAFVAAGCRVIAPDFFGFGRSDKPIARETYTFDFHRGALMRLIERLDLRNITLVCQDWGGLAGLTLPMDMPDRFARLMVMNTALATGESVPSAGFVAWRAFVASQDDLNVGALMRRATPGLTDAEQRAYDAPFDGPDSKAGVHTFPAIVPTSPDMPGAALSRRAVAWWSTAWSGPTFMAVGAQDPVLGVDVMRRLRSVIRGCPEPLIVPEAGHFVQEHGATLVEAALRAFEEQRGD